MILWLRWALGCFLFFSAAMFLLRAQPHDDLALRTFLEPPAGCAVPCWQGIRPGVTSGEEAKQILSAHPWVERLEPWGKTTTMLWWSGRQPAFLNTAFPGIMTIENNIVQRISLPTTVPFGELWLLYDQPARGGFICMGRAWKQAVIHFATYPRAGFSISLKDELPPRCVPNVLGEHCPIAMPSLWSAPTDVILGPVYVQLDDYTTIRSQSPPFCLF